MPDPESLHRHPLREGAGSLSREFLFLLFPNRDFAEQKYRDHRRLTIIVTVFLAILWPALWTWDFVTDPQGAANTIGLRLLFLSTLLLPLAIYLNKHVRAWLVAYCLLGGLAAEANFVEILNRLDGGMIHGPAGFMYCMFVAILAFQCFSLSVSLLYTGLAAVFPHLLAFFGLARGFPHLQYAMLMWPAALLTILAQVALAHQYLRRYELQRKLEGLSNTDPLSGARNRRYFVPALEHEVLRARRMRQKLAVLMLDIDHFKRVNDTYGHPTGDLVICRVAELCRLASRELDVVARLGGEEFAVLLPGSDLMQAAGVAERIRRLVEADSVQSLEDGEFRFTISVGVAELDELDGSGAELLARADTALYQAKEGGRNRVVARRPLSSAETAEAAAS